MEYRKLGKSGLEVSVVAYGDGMAQDDEETQKKTNEIINKCFEVGINFFDTAEAYGLGQHETLLGRALKQSGKRREDYVVSTKVFTGEPSNPNGVGTSRKRIVEALNASLKRLQLEYVDIVFSHNYDEDMPLEEAVFGFAQVVKEGKALYWATSNWSADQIIDAISIANKYGLPAPVADQGQYNLLCRKDIEKNFTYLFDNFGYGATVYAPVAGGLLTNRFIEKVDKESTRFAAPIISKLFNYEDFFSPEKEEESRKKWAQLLEIAKELGTDNLSVFATAWVIKNKDVSSTIIGFTKPQYIDDAVTAVSISKKITKEIEEKINGVLDNRPDLGLNWKTRQPRIDRRLSQY